ncbi:histidine phosphatase family protein [Ruminococcus sp. Marseille-P6503]|uniref:histidine phosphatase family protein n=1 Tax=Ruminococcus sp. Marseille-P6503 TaxID=2364796 RepID=UPI000F531C24|nr:histidine phosphatase family protein [Ruminococcus sp. Marseille-P6503]
MLYIMRHGITSWNERHKMQGRTDIPLNDRGREMARKAREEYSNIHFDVCYSSPLIRALETAEIVLENRNVPIITDDRLIEMSFGEYEGLANSFQIPDCPINVIFQNPELYTHSIGGAETFEQLFQRTGDFLEEIVKPQLDIGRDILIVGHGAMNCSIIAGIKKLPIEQFWSVGIEQCKIMRIL